MSIRKSFATWLRCTFGMSFIRFVAVGAVGFGLSTFVLWLLHSHWGVNIFWATLIASEVGLLWNFVFHNWWTYSNLDHRHKSTVRKLAEFHATSWSGVVILTLIETVAVTVFHFEYLISFIVAGSFTMFWNFFWTKLFIFKDRQAG